jgi:hypothetical protein
MFDGSYKKIIPFLEKSEHLYIRERYCEFYKKCGNVSIDIGESFTSRAFIRIFWLESKIETEELAISREKSCQRQYDTLQCYVPRTCIYFLHPFKKRFDISLLDVSILLYLPS